ncbi:AAA family ATPase [uncultured Fluviicola sp.]|uniref:AAA family ATPase n=1 Tax=uncultured Fluviicola sp. TaxID=463303 RepID=UPI0025F6005F|nr:AAA family ATPase [uncultured Fluviicola sp.]
MEMILFCGIQATGKTTFFKEYFFKTHMRISMDQLNTRNKEQKFIETCLSIQQPFVVDNTNPTKEDRERYISIAKSNRFKVVGYYFQSKLGESISRNNQRTGKENIPEVGIKGTFSKLEIPGFEEGFDELYYVKIENNAFKINHWENEI